MSFLKSDTPLDLVKHLLVMGVATAALVFGFFFVYLPLTTNHGETIVVPKITGMNQADLDDYLDERNLRFFVDDSSYTPGTRPFTVLNQDPAPGERVKEDRKIYITVAMRNPPVIKMPKLTDGSQKNAQMILSSYSLTVGQIRLVPNIQQNAVLRQLVNGKDIAPGAAIAKGTRVTWKWATAWATRNFRYPTSSTCPLTKPPPCSWARACSSAKPSINPLRRAKPKARW